MIEEARLEQLETGLAPVSDGWFVVNIRDAAWVTNEALGAACIFESDDALRQAVRVNRRAFGLSVARLRGKSEMHIKLVVRDGSLREAMIDVQLPDTVGGDYLSKLKVKASRERERQTKARALSVQVHKLFNPLEEEVSCKKVAPEGMLIDIAHLIDTKSVEKYQNRYSTATKQLKNCEVTVSGPWPPYHFLPGKLRTVAGNS